MSLDIWLRDEEEVCSACGRGGECGTVFDANITHNLHAMWDEAGVGDALYESEGKRAGDILPALEAGLAAMRSDPRRFEKHNAPNGWGLYKHAVPWLERLIAACRKWPRTVIHISR